MGLRNGLKSIWRYLKITSAICKMSLFGKWLPRSKYTSFTNIFDESSFLAHLHLTASGNKLLCASGKPSVSSPWPTTKHHVNDNAPLDSNILGLFCKGFFTLPLRGYLEFMSEIQILTCLCFHTNILRHVCFCKRPFLPSPRRLCFLLCLFVEWLVCQPHYTKTTARISTKPWCRVVVSLE